MNRRSATFAAVLLAVVLTTTLALPALGCPVCYGESEGEVITGTKWSVAFLGGLVYVLLGGVGALVLVQRKRLRRMAEEAADPHHGLRLVAGDRPDDASHSEPAPRSGPVTDNDPDRAD